MMESTNKRKSTGRPDPKSFLGSKANISSTSPEVLRQASSGRQSTSSVLGNVELAKFTHSHVLKAIINRFDGEPEELFEAKNWKKWIREEANRCNCNDRFKNAEVLATFAEACITLFFNKENEEYMAKILQNMSPNQINRFQKGFKNREEDELVNLTYRAQSSTDSDFPRRKTANMNTGFSDKFDFKDEYQRLCQKSTRSYTSPISAPAGKTGGTDIYPKRLFPGSGPSSSPNQKKKRITLIPNSGDVKKSQTPGSAQKKNNLYYSPLPIKRANTTSLARNESQQSPEGKSLHLLRTKELEARRIDQKSQTLVSREQDPNDFYLENDTPPCSPHNMMNFGDENISSEMNKLVPQSRDTKSRKYPITIASNSFYGPSAAAANTLTAYKFPSPKRTGLDTSFNCGDSLRKPIDKRKSPLTIDRTTPRIFQKNITPDRALANAEKDANSTFELPDKNVEPSADQDKENYPFTDEEIIAKYPRPISAPPLTLEMFGEIKQALDKPPKEVVSYGFSLKVLQEDLNILNNDFGWLIDLNMDFYLELIRERSKNEGYPRVYIFHSFFYTLLSSKDSGGGYPAVKETTGDDDIFQYDLVFIPVNAGEHWRLVVLEFAKKRIKIYDSLARENLQVIKDVIGFLRREYYRKHLKGKGVSSTIQSEKEANCEETGGDGEKSPPMTPDEPPSLQEIFNWEEWDVDYENKEDIPRQKNATDCGVFTLQYAEYLSRSAEFDFDQSHIRYFRKRMMYEFITKTLLT